MIYNVTPSNFGGPMRNGDLIALCNLVQGMRNELNTNDISVYVPNESIQNKSYIQEMRDWLVEYTDYFSNVPGLSYFTKNNVNLWDRRCLYGDVVSINPTRPQKNKIVISPLLDATYNKYRNWSGEMFERICSYYTNKWFDDYEKVIISSNSLNPISGFQISYNFLDNLNHIQESNVYVGGDTGLSHFVSSLSDKGRRINYFYGSHGLIHTNPFYSGMGHGYMNQFIENEYNLKNL